MPKHRVLVIGVGSIGERHLRCFQATGRAELSLCEVNETLGADVAHRYGVTETFARFEDALAARPEIAVIATPAQLHVAQATRLAATHVHLLIEKPLGISLDGVDQLRAVVADQRLTVAVGYVSHLYPCLNAMRRALIEGRFRRPVQIVVTCGQALPYLPPGLPLHLL